MTSSSAAQVLSALPKPSEQDAENAIRVLLSYLGEDPDRDGLIKTPSRVRRAFVELTEGYSLDPTAVLSTTFVGDSDQMVLLKDIEYTSCCEHHLLPFSGKAHVAYLPSKGRIVGLSKLARVVDVFAKRLQVQERLTQQIADAIVTALEPAGVGVVIEGVHSCMCVRGIRKHGATMITSALRGVFHSSPMTRSEFMALIKP